MIHSKRIVMTTTITRIGFTIAMETMRGRKGKFMISHVKEGDVSKKPIGSMNLLKIAINMTVGIVPGQIPCSCGMHTVKVRH
jgi:hypothetical protein